jgi:hypothetical protein
MTTVVMERFAVPSGVREMQKLDFTRKRALRDYTSAIDAYVWTRRRLGRRGVVVERIAALMPCPDVVAAKDVEAPRAADPGQREADHDVGWGSVLADVVHADRGDRVGGAFHPRPTVAAR